MLECLFFLYFKIKNAYLTARRSNPLLLGGEYQLNLRLLREQNPQRAKSAKFHGNIRIVLVDLAVIAAALAAIFGIYKLCRLIKEAF